MGVDGCDRRRWRRHRVPRRADRVPAVHQRGLRRRGRRDRARDVAAGSPTNAPRRSRRSSAQKSMPESAGIQCRVRCTASRHCSRSSVSSWLDVRPRHPRAREVGDGLVMTDGEAGEEPAPSVVASRTGEISTGFCAASASACTNVGLSVMPPSTRRRRDRMPGVGLGRLHEVGAAVGDALEHRAHDLRPAGAAGEAEQRAARAVVPLRRAEAEQRGDEHDAAACRRTARDARATRGRVAMTPEVVAQPLHVRAGREHDRLEPPGVGPSCRHAMIGNVPPRRGSRTAARSSPSDEVEHAAGAERDLRRHRGARSPVRRATPAGRRASAAIGGAPGSAVAVADDPASSRRSSAACGPGCCSDSSGACRQPDAVGVA